MIYQDEELNIESLEYRITFDPDKRIAVIVPHLGLSSESGAMLSCSLEVDGFELIESLAVPISDKLRTLELPEVKIVRPRPNLAYKFKLFIYKDIDHDPNVVERDVVILAE